MARRRRSQGSGWGGFWRWVIQYDKNKTKRSTERRRQFTKMALEAERRAEREERELDREYVRLQKELRRKKERERKERLAAEKEKRLRQERLEKAQAEKAAAEKYTKQVKAIETQLDAVKKDALTTVIEQPHSFTYAGTTRGKTVFINMLLVELQVRAAETGDFVYFLSPIIKASNKITGVRLFGEDENFDDILRGLEEINALYAFRSQNRVTEPKIRVVIDEVPRIAGHPTTKAVWGDFITKITSTGRHWGIHLTMATQGKTVSSVGGQGSYDMLLNNCTWYDILRNPVTEARSLVCTSKDDREDYRHYILSEFHEITEQDLERLIKKQLTFPLPTTMYDAENLPKHFPQSVALVWDIAAPVFSAMPLMTDTAGTQVIPPGWPPDVSERLAAHVAEYGVRSNGKLQQVKKFCEACGVTYHNDRVAEIQQMLEELEK